jgi:hypothetical protein
MTAMNSAQAASRDQNGDVVDNIDPAARPTRRIISTEEKIALLAAGDNLDRLRSESAFAKLCGVASFPASSGKTSGRYRINRGGNRQANAALYRAVIVRMRWHKPTIPYVKKHTADGLSKNDIIRYMNRYLVRQVYRLLPPPSMSNSESGTA